MMRFGGFCREGPALRGSCPDPKEGDTQGQRRQAEDDQFPPGGGEDEDPTSQGDEAGQRIEPDTVGPG